MLHFIVKVASASTCSSVIRLIILAIIICSCILALLSITCSSRFFLSSLSPPRIGAPLHVLLIKVLPTHAVRLICDLSWTSNFLLSSKWTIFDSRILHEHTEYRHYIHICVSHSHSAWDESMRASTFSRNSNWVKSLCLSDQWSKSNLLMSLCNCWMKNSSIKTARERRAGEKKNAMTLLCT